MIIAAISHSNDQRIGDFCDAKQRSPQGGSNTATLAADDLSEFGCVKQMTVSQFGRAGL